MKKIIVLSALLGVSFGPLLVMAQNQGKPSQDKVTMAVFG